MIFVSWKSWTREEWRLRRDGVSGGGIPTDHHVLSSTAEVSSSHGLLPDQIVEAVKGDPFRVLLSRIVLFVGEPALPILRTCINSARDSHQT